MSMRGQFRVDWWSQIQAGRCKLSQVGRVEESRACPRAIALAITILLHLAILVALMVTGSVHLAAPRKQPLVLYFPGPQAPALGDRANPAPPVEPSDESEADPVPPVQAPAPALPVEAPPFPLPEPVDPAALEPHFDAEPDPALTGDAPALASSGVAVGGAGATCPWVPLLRQALEGDLAARAALARIPRPSRSVANAVMLWDGRWIPAERLGGPTALNAVRAAITRALTTGPEVCRSEVVLGPVFVPLLDREGTLVLALGSGEWRGTDLLAAGFPGIGDR